MRCGKPAADGENSITVESQPARMRCGKVSIGMTAEQYWGRNPRECAVAKNPEDMRYYNGERRNPHECAVAKITMSSMCIIP